MWRVHRTLGAVCLQVLCLLIHCECLSPAEYNRQRQSLLQAEQSRRFGSSYVLNVGEKKLSRILIEAKQREFNSSRVNGTIFPPSVSFFKTKKIIEKSQVFQIIRRMPKGRFAYCHLFLELIDVRHMSWVVSVGVFADVSSIHDLSFSVFVRQVYFMLVIRSCYFSINMRIIC